MKDFVKNLIKDIAVDLNDEFGRNFERKAFFDQPWEQSKLHNQRGSLMMRTGQLRNSLNYKISNDSITWSSSLPYASIHNEGGHITVTPKMKKFFWAMYYKTSGAVTKTKSGKPSASKRNVHLSQEAAYWKSLALMKPGSQIKIPERRFIGNHPKVRTAIRSVIEDNLKDLDNYVRQIFKKP